MWLHAEEKHHFKYKGTDDEIYRDGKIHTMQN